MKTNRIIQRAMLACLLALGAQPASAGLKIIPVFIGGAPPTTNFIGTGNLQELFQVAAETWEHVFRHGGGNWTVTIYYGWTNSLPIVGSPAENGLYAQELFLGEGGHPVRMTNSLILFNNSHPFPTNQAPRNLFLDPNPRDNLKYLRYTTERYDPGDGTSQINIGRILTENVDAAESVDVLELCMHEIGHSLGLDDDYSGFKSQNVGNLYVVVTEPRPYAGLHIHIDNGPHIGSLPSLLSQFKLDAGERKLISVADALLIAQLNSFDNPDLDGLPGEPDLEAGRLK
jgi:hypothetical protein